MLTRAIFRALCALLVGFLLVSNPTEMTVLLVQIIGGLFAFSGLLAIIGYFVTRVKQSGFRPVFPIVGIGSLAFGAILLLWPDKFVDFLMYVMGGLLVLIGIGQITNLINYRKFSPLSWSLFVLPLLLLAAGVMVIAYPIEAAAVPFTILGVAYIIYGVGEFLLGLRFHRNRRLYDATQNDLHEVQDAEFVEVIEDEQTAGASLTPKV